MINRAGGVLAVLLLSLATSALLIGCGRKGAGAKEGDPPVTQVLVSSSDVLRVENRRIESGVPFTGELRPSQTVEITARFAGDLDDVLVREGQHVNRGQALARFRPRDVEDALEAANAQLLAAQASLRAAENAERRARKLLEAGAASPSDLEAAEAQRTAAQAQVNAATAMKNQAQEDAERLDVPAPIDGWVSHVTVHRGDRVAVGDNMLTLVDTATLELSATVPSEALGRVEPGTPIRFRVDAFPGETFDGKVDRVNPTTEPGTRQVRIYMRLPNPEGRLVGGLFASGRVVDSMKEHALAASISALRKEGSEEVVYRIRNGKAERIRVTTGLLDEETNIVELNGEVDEGDSLLSGVVPGLRDGAPVRVLAGKEAAAAGETGTGNPSRGN